MASSSCENHVEVFLAIADFETISHEDITELLDLQPSKIYVKGQRINPNFERLAPWNRWLLQMYAKEGPWPLFEEQMNALAVLVLPRAEAFRALSNQCTFEIGCAVMAYSKKESTPSVHLDRKHVELLELLKAEFDVDIYR